MKKKVLIAHGNRLIREVTKVVIEEKNILEVSEATNGEEALRLVQKKSFDLLITDVRMPEMNGIELIDQLRESGSSIPILITSTILNNHTRNHLGSHRSIYFMEKPFSIDQLAKTVENIIC